MNFSDEELAEMEAQYKDLDPKVIQIQILVELQAIRMALTQPQGESETTEVYTCNACQESIPSDELKSHAVTEHSAPADMPVEDLGLYSL